MGGRSTPVQSHVVISAPSANGLRTVLNQQVVGDTRYNDVAGFPGRTVGLGLAITRSSTRTPGRE